MENKPTRSPLICIIVASYRNADYLKEMINSVILQTYKNWELLITDDCSPDESNQVIEPFLKDKRITLFKHKENTGAGGAFLTSVNNAKGQIVAMLGADDQLKPNALGDLAVSYQKHPKAVMIVGGLELRDNSMKKLIKRKKFSGFKPGTKSILENGYAQGWDTFLLEAYKKTEGFTLEQKRAVDQDLYFKMEEVGEVVFTDDYNYLYRQNKHGISQGENAVTALNYNIIAIKKALLRRRWSNKKTTILQEFNYKYYMKNVVIYYRKRQILKLVSNLVIALFYRPNGVFSKYDILSRNQANKYQN